MKYYLSAGQFIEEQGKLSSVTDAYGRLIYLDPSKHAQGCEFCNANQTSTIIDETYKYICNNNILGIEDFEVTNLPDCNCVYRDGIPYSSFVRIEDEPAVTASVFPECISHPVLSPQHNPMMRDAIKTNYSMCKLGFDNEIGVVKILPNGAAVTLSNSAQGMSITTSTAAGSMLTSIQPGCYLALDSKEEYRIIGRNVQYTVPDMLNFTYKFILGTMMFAVLIMVALKL